MRDTVAVIEAKSTVTLKALTQLEKASVEIESVFSRKAKMFVGGANFEESLRLAALNRGIYVVATDANRYKIQKPWPKSLRHS